MTAASFKRSWRRRLPAGAPALAATTQPRLRLSTRFDGVAGASITARFEPAAGTLPCLP